MEKFDDLKLKISDQVKNQFIHKAWWDSWDQVTIGIGYSVWYRVCDQVGYQVRKQLKMETREKV